MSQSKTTPEKGGVSRPTPLTQEEKLEMQEFEPAYSGTVCGMTTGSRTCTGCDKHKANGL